MGSGLVASQEGVSWKFFKNLLMATQKEDWTVIVTAEIMGYLSVSLLATEYLV